MIRIAAFVLAVGAIGGPALAADPMAEPWEHWNMLSFDKQRRTLVLRQFHVEGFVNTYRLAEAATTKPGTVVFESESFDKTYSRTQLRRVPR